LFGGKSTPLCGRNLSVYDGPRPFTLSRLTTYFVRYNVGVLASVLVHPGFKKALQTPDAPRNGLITAIYYVGSWLSYMFFAHPAADRLGRRYAALVGMAVICVGQALQTGASGSHALGMVIAGRIVAGMGTAIISTSVPLYQRYVPGS
jgi:MFS family permease